MNRNSLVLVNSASHGISACIDMEDISCTQKTLGAFLKPEADGYPVGIALQAHLTRTNGDIVPLQARKSRMNG
jgi:proline dehydrogenase